MFLVRSNDAKQLFMIRHPSNIKRISRFDVNGVVYTVCDSDVNSQIISDVDLSVRATARQHNKHH